MRLRCVVRVLVFFGGGVACVLRLGVCYCALLLRLPLRGRFLPRARSPICPRLPFVPLSFCACGAEVLFFFAASSCGRACVPLCLGRVLPLFPFLSPFLFPFPFCLLGPELPLEPVKAPGVAFNQSTQDSGRIKHATNRGYHFVSPSPPFSLRGIGENPMVFVETVPKRLFSEEFHDNKFR